MNLKEKAGERDARRRILEVAAELFAQHGFDGVSVRDIIRTARVNLGAVTYYFGSKESLFGEVLEAKVAPVLRKGEAIDRSGMSPEGKLRAVMEVYADYVLREDPGLRVLFSEMLLGGTRLPRAAVEGVRWRNAMFARVVRQGIREGSFRPCDIECAAWSFFGMLSAFILYQPFHERRSGEGAYSKRLVKRIVRATLDIFLRGLMRPGPGDQIPAAGLRRARKTAGRRRRKGSE